MFDKISALFNDNRAQVGGGMDLPGVMILLVIAGVVGFVGLQVMSTVIETTNLSENADDTEQDPDPLYEASEALEAAVDDAWGLIGVAFIVVILAVIIVYLSGLRGRR